MISLKSFPYRAQPNCNCFKLLTHLIANALPRALARAGRSKAARMAMIAMTTNNSIRVNADRFALYRRRLETKGITE